MISLMYLQNSLRALLIQKDVKLIVRLPHPVRRLRALLIQKDVKLPDTVIKIYTGLRALLIQKDVKPTHDDCSWYTV